MRAFPFFAISVVLVGSGADASVIDGSPPTFELSIPAAAGSEVLGRAFVFISTDASCTAEPRGLVGDGQDTEQLFGANVDGRAPNRTGNGLSEVKVIVSARDLGYPISNLTRIPLGVRYCLQAAFAPYTRYHRKDGHVVELPSMAANRVEGGALFDSPGVQYSAPLPATALRAGGTVRFTLARTVPASAEPSVGPANDTKYIKHVRVQSRMLSEFWGSPMFLEACVLLPAEFHERPEARYPTFLYQGHYHADWATPVSFSEEPPDPKLTGYEAVQAQYAYWLFRNWTAVGSGSGAARAPFEGARGLIVTLKHPTPYYDDSYAVNSAAQGPWGDALLTELLPEVERRFRGIGQGWARATYGGSTGGWESLAVQVKYPELFNGCWSSCPDPVSFKAYTTVNIYEDSNAYYQSTSKWKRTPRPAIRDAASNEIYPGYGSPMGQLQATQQEVGHKELVMGTHSRSLGQWDIWEATFSPLGADGYPARIWDKRTGEVNRTVAAYWREHFDLAHIIERDWHAAGLGRKLQGKIHVMVGASDTYYLNDGVYYLEETLNALKDPPFRDEHGGYVKYGVHDGRGYEHCFSGDDSVPNSIGRLTINERTIPQMVARMVATAPAGADVTSWRY